MRYFIRLYIRYIDKIWVFFCFMVDELCDFIQWFFIE